MPPKIRELKARLRKKGFSLARTRGDHTVWSHPAIPDALVLSGNDGNDAKPYQVRLVEEALRKVQDSKND